MFSSTYHLVIWLHRNWLKILVVLATSSVIIRLRFENQLKEIERTEMESERLYSHIKTAMDSVKVDAFGTHKIMLRMYPVTEPTEDVSISTEKVTLVSHCTPNHLHLVIDLTKRWQGPMSISVFAPSELLKFGVQYLVYLHKCFKEHLKRTSIHFVTMFPDVPIILPNRLRDFIDLEKLRCEQYQNFIKYGVTNYDLGTYKYPNNLLRNTAIREAESDYIFVIDIDLIPSLHMDRHFSTYIKINSYPQHNISSEQSPLIERKVYVVPAFEMNDSTGLVPSNKNELLKLWSLGTVRPFYYELCYKCHKPANYDFWKDIGEAEEFGVSHNVEWADPWEPFFIAPLHMALFDERFTQYGFNRISQACELHTAGFTFAVLNNAFLVHRGYKTSNNFHSTKNKEQEENRLLFRQFKQELKEKYPESERHC